MTRSALFTIARVAHSASRAVVQSFGATLLPTWDEATAAQRDHAVKWVEGVLAHPEPTDLEQFTLETRTSELVCRAIVAEMSRGSDDEGRP